MTIDSAPGAWTIFHMHSLVWFQNNYYPSLVDEELEDGEGCSRPKVVQLVRRT